MSTSERFADSVFKEPKPSDKVAALETTFNHFPDQKLGDFFDVAREESPTNHSTNINVHDSDAGSLTLAIDGASLDDIQQSIWSMFSEGLVSRTLGMSQEAARRRGAGTEHKVKVFGKFIGQVNDTHLTDSGKQTINEEAEAIYDEASRNSLRGRLFAQKLRFNTPESGGPFDPQEAQKIDAELFRDFRAKVLKEFTRGSTTTDNTELTQSRDRLASWRAEHIDRFHTEP